MKHSVTLLCLMVVLLTVAWAGAPTAVGVYAGLLPCADCSGIRTTIELRADGTFLMQEVYLKSDHGQDKPVVSLGRWTQEDDKITLSPGSDRPRYFAYKGVVMRMLSQSGEEIKSKLNYNLRRNRMALRPKTPMTLTGYYSYMADAGRFRECMTGKTFPVAMKGDNARLQSEYGKVRTEQNEKVFVTLEGYLSWEPKMEGKGTVESIFPTRFVSFDRNGSCPAGAAEATSLTQGGSVENTEWVLVELNGKSGIDAAKTPQIRLDSKEKRAGGVAGCNRFFGTYKLDGAGLSFGKMGSTMMACLKGMDVERDFLKALGAVKSYKLADGKLELYDSDVKLAVFAAK